jgi:hypothetical protein
LGVDRRILGTVMFAAAFGWVEAAIVVYLRRIYYSDGFVFPLRTIDNPILIVELIREAATLVMLMSVALIAGRRRWERFAFFCLAFGIWDLAFYAGLKLAIGWPASWGTWDILFLLPLPWLAPVYAPVSVAVILIVAGLAVARLCRNGCSGRADLATWLLGAAGVALVLFSFMHDLEAGRGRSLPQSYPVHLLLLGDACLLLSWRRFMRLSRAGIPIYQAEAPVSQTEGADAER